MSKQLRYYIASRLENAAQVKELKALLDAAGWHHTYDWTKHGAVRSQGTGRMQEVAHKEVRGVQDADVVIVLMPGGRGTHIEIGIALDDPHKRVWLHSNSPMLDFGVGEETCAFYHHERVHQVNGPLSMQSLAHLLFGEYGK